MKKLILILTLAAFACSPLLATAAEASSKSTVTAVKNVKKGKKKDGKKHGKKGGKKHGKKK